jgi:hypothetical protein
MIVVHVDDMPNEDFFKHMDLRHPLVRFQTRGEHEADHRLFPDKEHEHNPRITEKLAGQFS